MGSVVPCRGLCKCQQQRFNLIILQRPVETYERIAQPGQGKGRGRAGQGRRQGKVEGKARQRGSSRKSGAPTEAATLT